MAMLEPDVPPERKKKTIWLLAGGAASLLIPLAGALYLHWSQNAGAAGPSGRSDVFERREGEDRKIMPTVSAVVTSPSALTTPARSALIAGPAEKPAGSSLDFIKSNVEMQARVADPKSAPSAAPAASTAPPAEPAAKAPPLAAKKGKPGKKEFSMPKLQPSRGFTNFGSTGAKTSKAGAKSGAAGAPDLSGLPPGAENDPRVQAYLKAHQGQ